MKVVVDASVVVKWAIPEPHHVEAKALRDDHLRGEISAAAPPCLWLEVASALRKYAVRGLMRAEKAVEAMRLLRETGIEVIEPDLPRVLEESFKLGVTVYDAAYLVLAEELDAPFYTADEKLLRHHKA
ncbi:MAG: type II toxin-antitoxin system VapC family toxin, partial [Thermoproteus sp.]